MVILLFLFGLSVGSFLNVLIDRLPKGEQIFGGRSYCDHCRHKLAWYDLIPLFSFIFLRGRCRYCGQKISFYYPLVELITGVLFVMVARDTLQVTSSWLFISYVLLVTCCLVTVFFTDLKYGIIPDKVVFPAIGVTALFHLGGVWLANSFTPGESKPTPGVVPCFHLRGVSPSKAGPLHLGGVLLAGLTAALFFLFLVWITRGKGMGMGDVKLAFLMGLFLGFPKILVALYFAFLTGALISVILILSRKKRFGQTIPFGPFLVGGTICAMFWGQKAIDWWLRIIM